MTMMMIVMIKLDSDNNNKYKINATENMRHTVCLPAILNMSHALIDPEIQSINIK